MDAGLQIREYVIIADFAFPHDDGSPTQRLQLPDISLIPFDVSRQLVLPECNVGCGSGCESAVSVNMPEAAADLDDGAKSWEHNVR